MHPNSCLDVLYQIVVRKPYCVSKLIQFWNGGYRFYIYCKCPKINTFQKGRCTQTWAAIVLLFGTAAFLVFQSIKFNDNPFFKVAIVIFCTQEIMTNLSRNLPVNWNFIKINILTVEKIFQQKYFQNYSIAIMQINSLMISLNSYKAQFRLILPYLYQMVFLNKEQEYH